MIQFHSNLSVINNNSLSIKIKKDPTNLFPNKLNFTYEAKSTKDNILQLNLNFKDPLYVSCGSVKYLLL